MLAVMFTILMFMIHTLSSRGWLAGLLPYHDNRESLGGRCRTRTVGATIEIAEVAYLQRTQNIGAANHNTGNCVHVMIYKGFDRNLR